jgi:hypothetical protein
MLSKVTFDSQICTSGTVALLEFCGKDEHNEVYLYVTAFFQGCFLNRAIESMVLRNSDAILHLAKAHCGCHTDVEFHSIRSTHVVTATSADFNKSIQITAAMYNAHSLY